MHRDINNLEELEPRAIPEPTILKYIPDSSVPDVSLICGKPLPLPTKSSHSQEGRSKSYANWRNHELSWNVNSQTAHQNLVKRSNSDSVSFRNAVADKAWHVDDTFRETHNAAKSNTLPLPTKWNQAVVVQKDCHSPLSRQTNDSPHAPCCGHKTQDGNSPFSSPRNHTSIQAQRSFDNVQTPCHGHESQDKHFTFSPPRNRTSVQEYSCNVVKPILKNSLFKANSVTNPRIDNTKTDEHFLRRSVSEPNYDHHRCNSPQVPDHAYRVSSSAVSHCHHPNVIDGESDTVRDLLLLFKNQNEQIKSLQSQVAKLLKIHEENADCYENRRSVVSKPNAKMPSAYAHESSIAKNVVVSSQKSCLPRNFNLTGHPPQESPELRHHGDTLRNTIMEKKVSIGVMTSFEFSVQNSSFLADGEHQNAATVRDSNKNLTKSDSWRSNVHCSRKASTGPLDNISERTESYASSIMKQNSNCAGTSTSGNSGFRSANEISNRIEEENVRRCSPISELPLERDKNLEDTYSNKPTNFQVSPKVIENNTTYKNSPLQKQMQNVEDMRVSPNYEQEQKQTEFQLGNDEKNADEENGLEREENFSVPKNNYNRRHSEKERNQQWPRAAENTIEGSFALRSSDFEVPDVSPPSLDPSIHVDMREYSSDDENEESKCVPTVGWTFYKNVVGQVNRILHQIPESQDQETNKKINPFNNDFVSKANLLDSVKTATLEQLKMLGINYAEHSQFNGEHTQKKVTFDSSYCPTVDYHANVLQSSSSISETNASMHMKALALKYLSDEQLADLAAHNQGVEATKQKFQSINGTNMSMATMNYLQRYCLVSGIQTPSNEDKRSGNVLRHKKPQQMIVMKELVTQSSGHKHTTENPTSQRGRDNILDITTLKQQPKLL